MNILFDKQLFGLVSVVLTFAAYAPYYRSIFKGATRPHIFSWIVWGIANGLVSAAQFDKGAGPAAWVTGVTAALCFGIILLAIRRGEKTITRGDWISFIVALAGMPLWYFADDPLGAVILETAVDMAGCYPTMRKSYAAPYSENLPSWTISTIRSLLSVFAVEHYSLVTVLFPLATVLTNGGVSLMLIWRRRVAPARQ